MTEAVGISQFDTVQLQFVPEAYVGSGAVAQLEALAGLLGIRRLSEQCEVEQTNANHRLEPVIVITNTGPFAEHPRRVQGATGAPGGKASHLHLNIVALSLPVDGFEIQDLPYAPDRRRRDACAQAERPEWPC
jgi:hypothetical protein